MYARPNIHGMPGPILERADGYALRQDALRLCEKIRACDDVARHLESITDTVRSLHDRTDGDARAYLTDAVAALTDAVAGVKGARTALDESISPAMEEIL